MAEIRGLAESFRPRVRLRALANAAETRRDDATILATAKRFAGAIYMAGYAIEATLEYAVGRAKGLPDTHEFDR